MTVIRVVSLATAIGVLLTANAAAASTGNKETANPCAFPEALAEANEDADARKAYVGVLEADPSSSCARVEDLAGWAERDPSLARLRDDERFGKLLARFQPHLSWRMDDDISGDHVEKVTELIVENPGIGVSELTSAVRVRPAYVYRALAELEKEMRIRKEGRQYFPHG